MNNKQPIRVLEVFGRMNRGGAESMIMNLYRKMDKSRVQLDFMVHTEKHCQFDDERNLSLYFISDLYEKLPLKGYDFIICAVQVCLKLCKLLCGETLAVQR